MFKDYYNHVACIDCENLLLIEICLTDILEKEGFKRVNNITKYFFTNKIAYSYDLLSKLIRNYLIIGLFPGN